MLKRWWRQCKNHSRTIFSVCLVLTLVFILDQLLPVELSRYGVYPRVVDSLPGILTAPFIHGSWSHLLNNLVGLSIFSALCLLRSSRFFWLSSVMIVLLSGLLVWLFGRNAMHIGASGWIFGLWSLCIAMAWFDRRFKSMLIALLVIVFYGGMLWGVLPTQSHISFEYHFFGALAGIVCASIASRKPRWFKLNG